SELPGMTSVTLRELFPDLPPVIYPGDEGIVAVRRRTEEALKSVDMSRIKPEHTVNICSSHHGFTLLGGDPYAEMLKTIRDVIEVRTGCKNIRLRAGVGLRFRETEEYIRRYKLDEYFNGKAKGVAPVDEGVQIETEIGTLYGIKRIYDADWIVHAHNSDVREVHFHRMVDRAVKPFGMSYARLETRSTYHQNLGPRAANFIARAIFDSPFVQDKFAFSCFLTVAPHGILGVDADNDLYSLNERITEVGCRYYGKMMTLFGEIDECIVALDFPALSPMYSRPELSTPTLWAPTPICSISNRPFPHTPGTPRRSTAERAFPSCRISQDSTQQSKCAFTAMPGPAIRVLFSASIFRPWLWGRSRPTSSTGTRKTSII